MSAPHRHAFGTLLLFAVLLAACRPVTAPPPIDAAAIPDLITQLCGPDWQIANRAGEELAHIGQDAAQRLVQELITPTLPATEAGSCNAMLQRALADMSTDGANALQAQLGPESPLDLPQRISLVRPLLQMGDPGVQAVRALARGDDPQRPGSPLAINVLPFFDPDAADQLLAIAQKPPASTEERKAALTGLAWFGESTLPAQQALFALLDDNEKREVIVESLSTMQPQASPLIAEVVGDPKTSEMVRIAAVAALSRSAADPALAVKAMLSLLADKTDKTITPGLRRAVLEALGHHGDAAAPASSMLLNEIQDPTAELAPETIIALGEIGAGVPSVVSRLLELAQSCTPTATVASAAQALGTATATTEATQESVRSALTSLLACDDPDVKSAALVALGHRGAPALPTLLSFLTSTVPITLVEPLTTAFAAVGDDAAPGLVALLADSATTSQARTVITESLHSIGQPALPELLNAVQQGNTETRQRLLDGLYAVGPDAFGVLLWLNQADPDVHFDQKALEEVFAVVRLDPNSGVVAYPGAAVPAALPLLLEVAQVTDTPTADNAQAVRLIGMIGPPAAAAALALADLLKQTDDLQFQCQIAAAVQRIGPGAGATAPELAVALAGADPDDECELGPDGTLINSSTVTLIEALAALGPSARSAVTQLVTSLATPELRRPAAKALAAVGAAAHPALLHVLQHEEDADVRRAAAYALLKSTERIDGVTAAALRRMLTAAKTDQADQQVRAVVATALLTHQYPLPVNMVPLPMAVPLLRNCLDAPQLAQADLRLVGYDAYLDTCVYATPGVAPGGDEFIAWLASIFH